MKTISRVLGIWLLLAVIAGIYNNGSIPYPLGLILMFVFIYFGWIYKFKNKVEDMNYDDLDRKNEERKKRMEEIRKHSKKD
jgi:hypothetical protein